jgi:hypothetical protein
VQLQKRIHGFEELNAMLLIAQVVIAFFKFEVRDLLALLFKFAVHFLAVPDFDDAVFCPMGQTKRFSKGELSSSFGRICERQSLGAPKEAPKFLCYLIISAPDTYFRFQSMSSQRE